MAKMIIPKTETPANIIGILIMMAVGLGLFLILVISIIFSSFMGILWGICILFFIVGFSTPLYTISNVPAFHAGILVNSYSGEMRTVFPGVNWKLPWEKIQDEGYIDLRVDLKEVCEETYASQDALMETKYIYTIKPDISEEGNETPGEKIIRFSSFEPSAIKSKGRALFSMLLSDHYGKKEGKDLLKKKEINETVFGTENTPKQAIKDFEKEHAVKVTVRLEDSDFDAQTQKYRDTISGAKSIAEAIKAFMDKGMGRTEAEKIVKLLNISGYTETDFNLNVDAPHLKNLQNFSILGGPLTNNLAKKGGKK